MKVHTSMSYPIEASNGHQSDLLAYARSSGIAIDQGNLPPNGFRITRNGERIVVYGTTAVFQTIAFWMNHANRD